MRTDGVKAPSVRILLESPVLSVRGEVNPTRPGQYSTHGTLLQVVQRAA